MTLPVIAIHVCNLNSPGTCGLQIPLLDESQYDEYDPGIQSSKKVTGDALCGYTLFDERAVNAKMFISKNKIRECMYREERIAARQVQKPAQKQETSEEEFWQHARDKNSLPDISSNREYIPLNKEPKYAGYDTLHSRNMWVYDGNIMTDDVLLYELRVSIEPCGRWTKPVQKTDDN